MKVIIIDDEKAMHLIMRKMLRKIPDLEIVGMFHETASAFSYLVKNAVDLAFIDISMPKESGLQFARRIAEMNYNLPIIFVTSHKDYALDAFDVYALDYIVKPVSLERLEKAIKRARAIHHYNYTENKAKIRGKLFIDFFGGLEVYSTVGPVKWMSRKSEEVFAYLVMCRGRMVSRERIIENIFPEMAKKNAETYLNTVIYQIRKSLIPHGLKAIIHSNKDHYSVSLDEATIDFLNFEEKLASLDEKSPDYIENALKVEEIYRGPLFGERAFLWSLSDLERFNRMYSTFVKKVTAVLLTNKEYATAILLLKKLWSYNELDDEVVKLLLSSYAAQMDMDAYVTLYEQYTKTLKEELGVKPSKEFANYYLEQLNELNRKRSN
ncbi:response regulator [Caldibacillus lycopersici]|uniref:Response regulator n=1 Tax=Perspicuibacillus lycopersici TaxID=1325689 RepID=A0AAE3IWN9_9BACI|nr:response regulator [Perspicuibacillus lycopersici]MCU9613440.1 response regulator [Perspicuibacillus lycopersici]